MMIFALLFASLIADPFAFLAAHEAGGAHRAFGTNVAYAAQSEDGNWLHWQEARQLYQSGKYDDAFQSLSAQPSGNDPLYFYNLGTIAYRQGRTGAALGYFEKANRLKRHDPDIYHNLELTRSELEKTLGPGKLDPASNWTENLADQVSLEEIRGVFGAIMLILAIFWIRTYWKNRDLKATLLRPAALVGAVALLLVGGLYWTETLASSRSPAVALSRQSVRSGPGDTFVELGQVDAGAKVRLLGSASSEGAAAEEWLQVRFSPDGIGWVRAKDFLVID
jgi:tetratricopeptide (TPR) repeat protein